jgi:hypothetical protein
MDKGTAMTISRGAPPKRINLTDPKIKIPMFTATKIIVQGCEASILETVTFSGLSG